MASICNRAPESGKCAVLQRQKRGELRPDGPSQPADDIPGEVGLKEVTGPVGIVKTIADVGTQSRSVSVGIWNVLSLGAFIAINLGIMNLLPIPALDGGRIVGVLLTSGIEGVTKKKLNPKIEGLYPCWRHGASACPDGPHLV